MKINIGSRVTRTGEDIHVVTEIDNYGGGEFTCLCDTSGIYKRGETECNMVARYHLITNTDYPKLYDIAKHL